MPGDRLPSPVLTNLTQRLNVDLALEAAGLGIWEFDLVKGVVNWDERCRALYGFTQGSQIAYQQFIQRVHPDDVVRLGEELQRLAGLDSDGRYDVTYRVYEPDDINLRWVRSYGQATFADSGELIRFAGVAQEVTQQVQIHQQLELQVQLRTQELATTNHALRVINEQLVSSNQALETANSDLTRSNQNLEQFAYVASHDLQEPLRKIQQFGDLLKSRYAEAGQEALLYLERMQRAASRMSLLIKDLLAFSRIATTQVVARPVALNQLIEEVVDDLSMVIEESGAQIAVDPLPTVAGDRSQLSQLFQNLLGNALKFRHPASGGHQPLKPQIRIRAGLATSPDLPAGLVGSRNALVYHRIEVTDNGIGFDEKYADRIFQVFQRLHGRHEFAGTGIGLAVVHKVVTNHGGAITASSQPGQGATFRVYLPGSSASAS
ncbi:ATP-binding protein [Spirosoma sp.]|uniref:sensor histidine kinase n=1 Tax=Spirosoma sp. TaxID=1899569 RepID=UPI00261B1D26|nr:ATP-binding protein [Spirosoma sp.]MCX6212891.1 ATP-binding protein [Spirosoma sp.]